MPDISAFQQEDIITNYKNRDFRPESAEGKIYGNPGDKMKRIDNVVANSVMHECTKKRHIGIMQVAGKFFTPW